MRSIGGFRKGFEGSQDHDLLIRAVEQTKKVFHIPEILYHWRLHSSSTAMNHEVKPYATLAGIKSVEESLKRTNKEATVQPIKNLPGCYRVSYSLKTPEDITVVIHLQRGEHPNLRAIDQLIQSGRRAIKEIHFVSGFPLHNEIHHVLNPISVKHNVRITIRINERGTTAAINDAVHTSSGSSILLLANGFVPEHEDALHNLVSYAQHVGVVSSRIISADDYIVCAGIRITGEGKVVRIFSGAVSGHPGYFNSLRCVNNQSLFSMDYLLVRKLVFEHVGGLDETLSGDLASADFCMKVLGLGYQNVYIPDAAFVLPVRYSKLKFRLPEQDETERFVSKWKHITENDPSFNPNLNPENSGYDLNLC